ncbi:hypothetical protein MOB65_20490 [Bacillus inaquosorum]|uniref:hypothetical protein n=1 Tax=Bacillus inaquosorum TaxID=483913 RepID=UPI00228216AC|nr:hypothetical protein [Bacillus inaquosorum]MCY7911238.1 hypothetical protein [Bacillus inaquosorum]
MNKFAKVTVATMVAVGLGGVTFFTLGNDSEQAQATNKTHVTAQAGEKKQQSVTEKFVVKKKEDGMLLAMPLEKSQNAPDGYLLDDKYKIGDIVEVTYWNDDIFKERKVTGKELNSLKNKYSKKIKSIMKHN